ncbi:hypothetical protein OEZ85_014096 [Tetradesmus obliquus]|uniref:Protein kinase domain-containing protein n=1 Tax=Tetradesmus obliquus TaxID=3088 RepID=A0ABY8U6X3_TETOB|nr:hypothetical protein OEZ85_014096 [Tetradesmus obliquus]
MAPSTKPGQLSSTLRSNSSSTSGKAGATAAAGNQAAHQKTHQPQAGPHVSHPVLRPTGAQAPKDATFTVEQALHLEPQAADELAAARAAGAAALVKLSASNKSGKKTNFAVCLVPVASSSGAVLLQLEFWLDLDGQRADAERTGVKKLAAQVCRAAEAAVISTCQQGTSSITACSCETGELVAVKAVDATRFHSISEIEQVQEEMAVLAQLRHPNIIRLQEVVFAGGCFYFMMEYASGGSLAGHLAAQPGGRLGEAAAREVFDGILAALEYCHKRRVIHRDLKPENILMQDGTPKIADFGLAGVIAPFNGSGFKLQCGTPEFTAPEIVGGAEYDGTAVDLWSVGVMLYEALCGQLPFHGANQQALFRSIRRGAYAPLPKTISADARDLRSAVSFTSASCHDSVRVVIADSSRDDPIAAAIKRIAGSSGFNSPQPSPGPQTEELKHTTRERTVSNATIKAGSSIVVIGARYITVPCSALF